MRVFGVFLSFLSLSFSAVYFHETFNEGWEQRWVYSEDSSVTHGSFKHVQRTHCPDGEFGLKSLNDSSYYHMSAKFEQVLDTTKKPIFFQFVAQYEQSIDCGGAYLKLFETLEPKKLLGTSPYSIMFGPDVCGYGTKVVHFIVSHQGKNHQLKEAESFSSDTKSHLFELFIGVDRKFKLKIDGVVKKEGALDDHFSYLAPKMIDDPNDKKPEDWVDEEMMDDPEDKKPEDWDDRKHIPDETATKPDDWDDEKDGEWERDMIDNPNFKGEWTPKQIKNPAYKGVWTAKQIANPEYKDDKTFANFKLQYVGFDLWTVKSGTVFDEIYITDDAHEAETHATKVMELIATQNKAIEEAEKTSTPSADEEDDSKTPDVGDDRAEPEEEPISGDDHEDL